MQSCAQKNNSDNQTIRILEKLGVMENFQNAVKDFTPEALVNKNATIDSNSLASYKSKYFEPDLSHVLAKQMETIYSKEELDMIEPLDPEAMISHDPNKFKSFEDRLEKLYNEIYIDCNKLLSGIQETGQANPEKPFEFFTIKRPNGIYLVEAYDSYLPQNSKIATNALIDAKNFIDPQFEEISMASYGISFQLKESDQKLLDELLNKDPKTIVALIVNEKMVSLRQVDLIKTDHGYQWFAPWSEEEIKNFISALKQ